MVEGVVGQEVDHRLQHRDLDVASGAVVVAVEQGGQDREGPVDPAGQIGRWGADPGRWAVGAA